MVRLASSAMVIGAGFSKIGSGPSSALAAAVAGEDDSNSRKKRAMPIAG